MKIRSAAPSDAAEIAAIYAPIVAETTISFELEPPSVEEMRSRIEKTLPTLPWLVSEDSDGKVNGYVYASKHRDRAAYPNSSVHVHQVHARAQCSHDSDVDTPPKLDFD